LRRLGVERDVGCGWTEETVGNVGKEGFCDIELDETEVTAVDEEEDRDIEMLVLVDAEWLDR
jgi:hypothetical protein